MQKIHTDVCIMRMNKQNCSSGNLKLKQYPYRNSSETEAYMATHHRLFILLLHCLASKFWSGTLDTKWDNEMRIFWSSRSGLKVSMDEQYGHTKLLVLHTATQHVISNQAQGKRKIIWTWTLTSNGCRSLETFIYVLSRSANQQTVASTITTTRFLL